jgi:hypothetical protein
MKMTQEAKPAASLLPENRVLRTIVIGEVARASGTKFIDGSWLMTPARLLDVSEKVWAAASASTPAALPLQQDALELHPLTADLVARFARALSEKLADAEEKYGYGDGWLSPGWMDECRANLMEHVAKGDPRDVAAYCAFLWHHGERTALASLPPAPLGVPEGMVLVPTPHQFWLIERGANQGQSPTVWWSDKPAQGHSDSWVISVHDARHFASSEDAKVVAERQYLSNYAVISHGYLSAAPAASAAPADGWMPIDSAPKDGSRVILWWGGKSINGFYLDNSATKTPWAGWRVESMVIGPAGKHTLPLLVLPPLHPHQCRRERRAVRRCASAKKSARPGVSCLTNCARISACRACIARSVAQTWKRRPLSPPLPSKPQSRSAASARRALRKWHWTKWMRFRAMPSCIGGCSKSTATPPSTPLSVQP